MCCLCACESYSLCKAHVSRLKGITWLKKCFVQLLFHLQILYANEAESINPVEKEKEEQQTEVRCLWWCVVRFRSSACFNGLPWSLSVCLFVCLFVCLLVL